MSDVRAPLVEGIFYPSDKEELRELLQFNSTILPEDDIDRVDALVLPHGAYEFTLPYIRSGFSALATKNPSPKMILAVTGLHREKKPGLFLPPHRAFGSVFGEIPLERNLIEETRDIFDHVEIEEAPFLEEHAFDTLLSPLSLLFPGIPLIPMCIGDMEQQSIEALSRVLRHLENAGETALIISSNLSGEIDGKNVEERSRKLLEVLTQTPEEGGGETPAARLLRLYQEGKINACGSGALAGVLKIHLFFRSRVLKTGTSLLEDDSTGVGYGTVTITYELDEKEAHHAIRTE